MLTQTKTLTRDEIYDGVRDVLIEALSVDYQDVTPKARLVADLMAESIDNLDIILRLENRFNVKIRAEDVFPLTSFNIDELRYSRVDRTTYTPEVIAGLKRTHPHLNLDEFESEPSQRNLLESVTVGSVIEYLTRQLGVE